MPGEDDGEVGAKILVISEKIEPYGTCHCKCFCHSSSDCENIPEERKILCEDCSKYCYDN